MKINAIISYSVTVDDQTLQSLKLDTGWECLDSDQKRERLLQAADYIVEYDGLGRPLITACSDPSLEE